MKSLIRLLAVGLVCLSTAASGFWQSRDSNYNIAISTGGGAFTPNCTASGNFLARTSGLSTPQKTAYDTMICGMVTDGVITGNLASTGCGAYLDVFYVLAAPDRATSHLNICGTSYPLTEVNGPITFTANNGYNGNGTNQYMSTNGYIAGGAGSTCGNGAATCNFDPGNLGGHLFFYDGTSRALENTGLAPIGARDTNIATYMIDYWTYGPPSIYCAAAVNSAAAQGMVCTVDGGSRGLFLSNRGTGGNTQEIVQFATGGPYLTTAGPTTTPYYAITIEMTILARNNTTVPDSYETDLIMAAGVGANFGLPSNTGKSLQFSNRLNQFMIDIGAAYHY